MKTATMLTILVLALGLMVCASRVSEASPMGTAFTYQGHLYDANVIANGEYDLQFKLYDANSDGNQVGDDVNVPDMEVIDGYFTVSLDFNDANAFNGDARWLEIGVSPGDLNAPNYTELSPRQELTPVPYALQTRGIFVDNAGKVGIGTASPAERLDIGGNTKVNGDIYVSENTVNSGTPISSEQSTTSTSWVQLTSFDLPDQDSDRLVTLNVRLHARGGHEFETAEYIVRGFCYGDGSAVDLADHYSSAPLLGTIHIRSNAYNDYHLNLGPFAASDNQKWRFVVFYRTRNGSWAAYVDELEWQVRSIRYEY